MTDETTATPTATETPELMPSAPDAAVATAPNHSDQPQIDALVAQAEARYMDVCTQEVALINQIKQLKKQLKSVQKDRSGIAEYLKGLQAQEGGA